MPVLAPLPPPHRPNTDSLRAGLLAIVLAGALLAGWTEFGQALTKRYLHAITAELGGAENDESGRYRLNQSLEQAKNQGMAFQRLAFAEPDLLPLYGSSELLKPLANKANVFFRNYPTGFTVFPVGKPGSTCLILLQKLGSVADAVRGKRVALSLSPSWFYSKFGRIPYEGNFSTQQATLLAFSPDLSFGLKRDIARRLLTNERTMENSKFLKFVLELQAGLPWTGASFSHEQMDRLVYTALAPLGRLVCLLYEAQDQSEITSYILKHRRHWDVRNPPRLPRKIHWDACLAEASPPHSDAGNTAFTPPQTPDDAAYDDYFRARLNSSHEWEDLELLLRLLRELGAQPLLLSIPLDGPGLVRHGLAGPSLHLYPTRLREIAGRYGARVEAFEDHIGDPSFLSDQHDHLGERGWIYYDRSLDAFYHGR